MPMTDEQIRAMLLHANVTSGSVPCDPRDISELCTRVLDAEAKLETLSAVSDERWARVDVLARMVALEAERDALKVRAKVLEDALTKARASLDGVIGLYGLKTFTGSVVAWDEQPLHVRKVMEAEIEARKALEGK